MYLKFELYLKTLLKCTFFPKELGQSTQYKLLDLAYLPRTISVRCRYTHGILYTERQISVQATYIYRCVIWRGSEFGHADDNSCYICMLTRDLDPPGPAHLFSWTCSCVSSVFPEIASFSLTALMVNHNLGSRLQPTPFLRSLRCQNMTHGFI